MNGKKIILSRTDSIGDVILTLPMAGVLKNLYPSCHIIFLGNEYTRDVIRMSVNVDDFLNWDTLKQEREEEIAAFFAGLKADVFVHVFPDKKIAKVVKRSGIPLRIGTINRLYHWNTCNRLIKLSRRRSRLHEVQLNLKLLSNLGVRKLFTTDEIPAYYGLQKLPSLNNDLYRLLSKDKCNLILHPKSKGHTREWGIENFNRLIEILQEGNFQIFITGSKEEGMMLQESMIGKYPDITDLTGQLSLRELVAFISEADGLVAASTGPLHIAAALGKIAIGIYPPIKPMHPGRWGPLGKYASFLVADKSCNKCRRNKHCECMLQITPEMVNEKIAWGLRASNREL